MIATIQKVLQEKNGFRVVVDYEEFGECGHVFATGTTKDQVTREIESQKQLFLQAVESKEFMESLVGEKI